MKLAAMKRQAGRPSQKNSGQNDQNFGKVSRDVLAEEVGESSKQIQPLHSPYRIDSRIIGYGRCKEVEFYPLPLIFPTLIRKCRNGSTSISGIQDLSNQSRLQL